MKRIFYSLLFVSGLFCTSWTAEKLVKINIFNRTAETQKISFGDRSFIITKKETIMLTLTESTLRKVQLNDTKLRDVTNIYRTQPEQCNIEIYSEKDFGVLS